MIGNYANKRRDCSGTTCIARACTADALMQFPRYPAGLSRAFDSNGLFFKSPLKTSELGLRHGCGKTNRVTLIICAGLRKPEGISNSETMAAEWMTICETEAWYAKREKYFKSCIYHERREERKFLRHRRNVKAGFKSRFSICPENTFPRASCKREKRIFCIKKEFSYTWSRATSRDPSLFISLFAKIYLLRIIRS